MARKGVIICSGCLNDFPIDDMYTVSRASHKGDPKLGIHRVPHCEKCIKKNKDSYIAITGEPRNKK